MQPSVDRRHPPSSYMIRKEVTPPFKLDDRPWITINEQRLVALVCNMYNYCTFSLTIYLQVVLLTLGLVAPITVHHLILKPLPDKTTVHGR
jgi:hypothetical protein